jgi:protein-disulfide isomerase
MNEHLRRWHIPLLLVTATLFGMLTAAAAHLQPPDVRGGAADPDFERRVVAVLSMPGVLDRAMAASQQATARGRQTAWRRLVAREPQLVAAAPGLPALGNPQAAVRGIVFVDYNCGHCRNLHRSLQQLVERSPQIGVAILPLALLRPSSAIAALSVLAAAVQGRQSQLHDQLLQQTGEPDEAAIRRAAVQAGLDPDRLQRDAGSDAIRGELARLAALARRLDVTATPTGLFGNGVRIEGAASVERLQQMLVPAR